MNFENIDIASITSQATAAGFANVELYIKSLVEQDADRLAQWPDMALERDHAQWMKELKAWSDDHPGTAHFVDDSRDSIYEGRGSENLS